MSAEGNRRCQIPPFPPDYRASGLLLHVTSLPSPYGIGDLGPAAFAWIDRLYEAGQRWWQALPLGPTGYGNSPYQALSSFAGNALVISPQLLKEDGLLEPRDEHVSFADRRRRLRLSNPVQGKTARNGIGSIPKQGWEQSCARSMRNSARSRHPGWKTMRFSAP